MEPCICNSSITLEPIELPKIPQGSSGHHPELLLAAVVEKRNMPKLAPFSVLSKDKDVTFCHLLYVLEFFSFSLFCQMFKYPSHSTEVQIFLKYFLYPWS